MFVGAWTNAEVEGVAAPAAEVLAITFYTFSFDIVANFIANNCSVPLGAMLALRAPRSVGDSPNHALVLVNTELAQHYYVL